MIKIDMEMPKNCKDCFIGCCPAFVDAIGKHDMNWARESLAKQRAEGCPLMEDNCSCSSEDCKCSK